MRVLSVRAISPSVSTHLRALLAPIVRLAGRLGLGPGRTSLALGDNGMSQPSRPRARGPAQRRRRDLQIERPVPLEERRLPAPFVTTFPLIATFTPAPTPTNAFLGTVTVSENTTATPLDTAAPITSVAELTPNSSFGGDIVNIAAGPGGVFGKGLYAISRGAGANAG